MEGKKLIDNSSTQNELRRLKSETASLKEQQRKLVSTDDTQSPLKELANARFFPDSEATGGERRGGRERRGGGGGGGGGGEEGVWESAILKSAVEGEGGGWEGGGGGGGGGEGKVAVTMDGWEEFHDFGDVISSQGEINRLQAELSRVQLECRHWKTLAEEKVWLPQEAGQMITLSPSCLPPLSHLSPPLSPSSLPPLSLLSPTYSSSGTFWQWWSCGGRTGIPQRPG